MSPLIKENCNREVAHFIESFVHDHQCQSLQRLLACVEALLHMCTDAATHEEQHQKVLGQVLGVPPQWYLLRC